MPLLRVLPLALLLAACGPRWIAVAPGTPPVECATARLAARGWVVDTTYTDSIRLRVVMIEEGGISVDTVTAELQDPAPGGSYVKKESRWWYGEGAAHRYRGAVLDHLGQVGGALQSCGVNAYGWRRPARRPGS